MVEPNDVIKRIEQTQEIDLQQVLKHILHKVEVFAKSLGIDPNSATYFKTVLRNAVMLYFMLEESHDNIKERTTVEGCVATIQRIPSASQNKVEETLFLARDISQEYLLAKSIEFC